MKFSTYCEICFVFNRQGGSFTRQTQAPQPLQVFFFFKALNNWKHTFSCHQTFYSFTRCALEKWKTTNDGETSRSSFRATEKTWVSSQLSTSELQREKNVRDSNSNHSVPCTPKSVCIIQNHWTLSFAAFFGRKKNERSHLKFIGVFRARRWKKKFHTADGSVFITAAVMDRPQSRLSPCDSSWQWLMKN